VAAFSGVLMPSAPLNSPPAGMPTAGDPFADMTGDEWDVSRVGGRLTSHSTTVSLW